MRKLKLKFKRFVQKAKKERYLLKVAMTPVGLLAVGAFMMQAAGDTVVPRVRNRLKAIAKAVAASMKRQSIWFRRFWLQPR